MLEKAFSAIDIFGIPILLKFSRSKKAQSSFGGFCSLLFVGFVIWSIYNSGYELVARKKPQIVEGTAYSKTPGPIDISSMQLPFMFSLQANGMVDPNICQYSYSAGNVYYSMDNCTSDHFDPSFADLGDLSGFYCLPRSPKFTQVPVFLVLLNCSFQNITQEEFISQSPLAIVMYPKDGLTLTSYKNPVQYYFDLDFLPLTGNTTILNTWSISHLSITTDDGWLTTTENTEQYIEVENQVSRNIPTEGVTVRYTFGVSNQETYYLRSYKKIQNVLAEVGGIASTVFTVLSILVLPYARIKFSEAFVNELFETQQKKSDKAKAVKEPKLENENHHDSKTHQTVTATHNEKFIKLKNLQKQSQNNKLKNNSKSGNMSKSAISTRRKANEDINKSPRYENEGLLFKNQQDGESSEKMRLPYRKVHTQPIPSESWSHLEVTQQNDESNQNNANTGVIRLDELVWPSESPSDYKDPNKSIINIKEESHSVIIKKVELVAEKSDPQHRTHGILELDIEKQSIKNKNKVLDKLRKKSAKPKRIKSERVTISIFQYVWSFVSKSEPLKQKMIILNEGIKIMDERLDIFTLMKKLRDVDKMKGLILDKDQLFLFNRTSRPEIMNRDSYWYTEENLSNDILFGGSKDEIIDAQQRLEDKPQKSEIDKKLISLFSKPK